MKRRTIPAADMRFRRVIFKDSSGCLRLWIPEQLDQRDELDRKLLNLIRGYQFNRDRRRPCLYYQSMPSRQEGRLLQILTSGDYGFVFAYDPGLDVVNRIEVTCDVASLLGLPRIVVREAAGADTYLELYR